MPIHPTLRTLSRFGIIFIYVLLGVTGSIDTMSKTPETGNFRDLVHSNFIILNKILSNHYGNKYNMILSTNEHQFDHEDHKPRKQGNNFTNKRRYCHADQRERVRLC